MYRLKQKSGQNVETKSAFTPCENDYAMNVLKQVKENKNIYKMFIFLNKKQKLLVLLVFPY